jgi:uncharacterized protein YqfA (UPF0365 family)
MFTGALAVLVIVAAIVAVFVLFYFVPLGLWLQALTSGAHVGIGTLFAMRLRKVPPGSIVMPRIAALRAGINLSVEQLEGHYLAGGNVGLVVTALISADKADIPLTFERAAAIDLAGRNVLEAVQMSVLPKVITTPKITAMAKNGIQLSAFIKITVRTNLERLVGGATEETVVARVGEGVVSTIGSSDSHKDVLENPDKISKNVLAKGLDAGTAFEILSIDIADIDVGANIGAKLQAEQAEADKQIAQAHAESRRALAVAAEQEQKARVFEMRAKVVEAEAEVPMAVAEALRKGNIGVLDYYNMRNVVADTDMRRGIGESMAPPDKKPQE